MLMIRYCLIDCAVSYITDRVLRFNRVKTECLLFGSLSFTNNTNNLRLNIECIAQWK